MRSFEAVGTDPQRVALAAEVVRINARIHDRAMALVGPMPVPPDVTIQQLRVLDHVMKQPGLSGQELGALLGVSAPTASGLVERMVEKGLISRTDDVDDRRVRRLHPTEAGLDTMRRLDSMFERALAVVLLILVVMIGAGAFMSFIERRLLGLWQDRYGPNRVGPFGIFQLVADMLKMFFKEDWIPPFADRRIFILAPIIAFTAFLMAFVIASLVIS